MLADWWRVVLEDVPPEATAAPKDGEDGEGIGTNGGGGSSRGLVSRDYVLYRPYHPHPPVAVALPSP